VQRGVRHDVGPLPGEEREDPVVVELGRPPVDHGGVRHVVLEEDPVPSGSRWKKVNSDSLSFRSNGLSVTVEPSFNFTSLGIPGSLRVLLVRRYGVSMEHVTRFCFHYNGAGPAQPERGKMGGKVIVERDGRRDRHPLQPGEEERAEPEDPERVEGGADRLSEEGTRCLILRGEGARRSARVRHHPDPAGGAARPRSSSPATRSTT